jgi:hypothetical protein
VCLAGHGGEGGGDFLEAGFDVGGGGWSGVVGVAGVGAGDSVSEVAFDPGEGEVPPERWTGGYEIQAAARSDFS